MLNQKEQNFTHLILTPFNLDYTDHLTEQEVNKKLWIDSAWLNRRFELFEKYCFPSVKVQNEKNFSWLVFFHTDTPKQFKKKIEQYQKQMPNFIPIYIKIRPEIPDAIKKNIELKKWLITSRLDNDDALSIDYVKTVQGYFEPIHSSFIDLSMGYNLKIFDGAITVFDFYSNSFASYVTDTKIEIKTAHCFNHSYNKDQVNFKSYKTKPTWLQIIHEDNRSNTLRGEQASYEDFLDLKKRFKMNNVKIRNFLFINEEFNRFKQKPFKYLWSKTPFGKGCSLINS